MSLSRLLDLTHTHTVSLSRLLDLTHTHTVSVSRLLDLTHTLGRFSVKTVRAFRFYSMCFHAVVLYRLALHAANVGMMFLDQI